MRLTKCYQAVMLQNMVVETTPHEIRTRVFDVLAERGIRQDWFARQIGVSQTYLSRIKLGRTPISRRFMQDAVRVLGLPLEDLFFAVPLPPGSNSIPVRNTNNPDAA